MIFNSLVFGAFFSFFLILYWLPWPWTIRKLWLLAASYLFYAAWDPRFVPLLVLIGSMNFLLGFLIDHAKTQWWRSAMLTLSLTVNLGLLGYFKYSQFLLREIEWLSRQIMCPITIPPMSIVLPLGISFYTFETISYLVDIYRNREKPTRSYLDYSLFLVFFPHLVAGPIMRAHDFLPQCAQPRDFDADRFSWGISLLTIGLFQKIFLSDGMLADVADLVFQKWPDATGFDTWIGVLAFAGQIYFDFAGYSLCGIGAALCCGFVLSDNFRAPYGACGFSDFWQRWHISLSSWLRDYLYFPLGGNRHGSVRTYFNLMATMLIGGLWHGASWSFVLWGGLHGALLVVERIVRLFISEQTSRNYAVRVVGMLLTFVAVCFSWVPFRAESFTQAASMIVTMAVGTSGMHVIQSAQAFRIAVVIGGMVLSQMLLRNVSWEDVRRHCPWWSWSLLLSFLWLLIWFCPGASHAFIYFQF